jgi:hypothetical protein
MKYWQQNCSEFSKETRKPSAMDNQPLMLSQTTTITSIKLHLTDTNLAQKLIDYMKKSNRSLNSTPYYCKEKKSHTNQRKFPYSRKEETKRSTHLHSRFAWQLELW